MNRPGFVSQKATVLVRPRTCPETKKIYYLAVFCQNVGCICIAPNVLRIEVVPPSAILNVQMSTEMPKLEEARHNFYALLCDAKPGFG
jgi:hypothetical protein